MNDDYDERIEAWDEIARHPFFAKCYTSEEPLIRSMLRALDAQTKASEAITTQAEESAEDRIRRAYLNGFRDGAERASRGRWDHT